MKRHELGTLGRLLILGLMVALTMMTGTNSAQGGAGTFPKARSAQKFIIQDPH